MNNEIRLELEKWPRVFEFRGSGGFVVMFRYFDLAMRSKSKIGTI